MKLETFPIELRWRKKKHPYREKEKERNEFAICHLGSGRYSIPLFDKLYCTIMENYAAAPTVGIPKHPIHFKTD